MSLANEFAASHTNWISDLITLSIFIHSPKTVMFLQMVFSVGKLACCIIGVFFGDSQKFVLVKFSVEFDLQCLSWPSHKPSTVIER